MIGPECNETHSAATVTDINLSFSALQAKVAPALQRAMPGWAIEWMMQVTSSNALLGERAAAGESIDSCFLIVDEQTAGRGRLGRRWSAPRGCALQMSLAIEGERAAAIKPGAAWRVSLAISEALDTLPELNRAVYLKWPNDLWLDNGKCGGVLLESRVRRGKIASVIVGVGVNVNAAPDVSMLDRQQQVAALVDASPVVDRASVLCAIGPAIADAIVSALSAAQDLDARCRYHDRMLWYKQMLEISPTIGNGGGVLRGRCEGIDDDGALVLATTNGVHRISDSQTGIRVCNEITS
ncbi:biotin--[acetyl-CoA-carboxylase] ligase [Gammaproteobacteria bacterium]|nr:biotin--[acetyl-CoA-carboxylase] ligase [Gammaproteobacteria bacterium]